CRRGTPSSTRGSRRRARRAPDPASCALNTTSIGARLDRRRGRSKRAAEGGWAWRNATSWGTRAGPDHASPRSALSTDLALSPAMHEPEPLGLIGTCIAGKYMVTQLVGETELSAVYRATHVLWKRPVAVKVFKEGGASEDARDELLASFVREGA